MAKIKMRKRKELARKIAKLYDKYANIYSSYDEDEFYGWSIGALAENDAKIDMRKMHPKYERCINYCFLNWGWKNWRELMYYFRY